MGGTAPNGSNLTLQHYSMQCLNMLTYRITIFVAIFKTTLPSTQKPTQRYTFFTNVQQLFTERHDVQPTAAPAPIQPRNAATTDDDGLRSLPVCRPTQKGLTHAQHEVLTHGRPAAEG